jgi:hypothetical protein
MAYTNPSNLFWKEISLSGVMFYSQRKREKEGKREIWREIRDSVYCSFFTQHLFCIEFLLIRKFPPYSHERQLFSLFLPFHQHSLTLHLESLVSMISLTTFHQHSFTSQLAICSINQLINFHPHSPQNWGLFQPIS